MTARKKKIDEKPRHRFNWLIKEFFLLNPRSKATVRAYKAAQVQVNAFCKEEYGDEDLYLDEFNLRLITRLQVWMLKQHRRKVNGKLADTTLSPKCVHDYLSKVVSLFHFAEKMEILDRYPFRQFDTKLNLILTHSAEMLDRKLSSNDLRMIESTNIGGSYRTERTRQLFLLQRWTGMAWADLNKNKDIRQCIRNDDKGNETIMYNRVKTGELAIVPMFPETRALLGKLEYKIGPGSYTSYYENIIKLFEFFQLNPEELGTHTGRHLFGSEMLEMGFSIESVSRMMGHSTIEETQNVYAKVNKNKIFADYSKIKDKEQPAPSPPINP